MLHAFIDESYSDDWFFMAAAIAHDESQMETLEGDWAALLDRANERYRPHREPVDEFHTYDVISGEGPWSTVDLHDRMSLVGQVLGLLRDHRVEFVIRGIDRAAQRMKYREAYEPYPLVLTHLMREVDGLAHERHDQARMVCDEIHQNDRHRAMLDRHRVQGTPGYRSTTLRRVVGALEFTSSESTPLVQAADLVAYLAHRRASRPNPPRAERRARDNHWRIIEPQIVHQYCCVP